MFYPRLGLTLCCFLFLTIGLKAQNLTLHPVFQDNMVIQSDAPFVLKGKAESRSKVSVSFKGKSYETKSNKKGHWSIQLPSEKAGPYSISVSGKQEALELKDVLFGDVWLCGGQSNMEFQVERFEWAQEEAQKADYTNIRLATVQRQMAFEPQNSVDVSKWKKAQGSNIMDFSAVGYHFGRSLRENGVEVPLGLLSSNWGGTPVESWISYKSLEDYEVVQPLIRFQKKMAKKGLQPSDLYTSVTQNQMKRLSEFARGTKASKEEWYQPKIQAAWDKELELPFEMEELPQSEEQREIWLSQQISLPVPYKKKALRLNLARWAGYTRVFFNGQEIGEAYGEGKWINYTIPKRLVQPNKNNISIQYLPTGEKQGSFDNPLYYNFHPAGDESSYQLLSTTWRYKWGEEIPKQLRTEKQQVELYTPMRAAHRVPQAVVSSLYNGMIHPISFLKFKGVVWYQGESNSGRAASYKELFPMVIEDWRKQLDQADLPFYFVQIANYRQACEAPCPSEWAELREAQATALKLHHTGMATAIDVGEADDIHPEDKQTVGYRLALWALKNQYKQEVVARGPVYKKMEKKPGYILLTFETPKPLIAKGKWPYLFGFSIAAADKEWKFAKAEIVNARQVKVYHPEVEEPVAVRYAWADNPADANLYDTGGLPAYPFRTDQWPMLTEGQTLLDRYSFLKEIKQK